MSRRTQSPKAGPAGGACPCGTGRAYAACCGPWHAGAPAPTPEALMRSRYTAYARGGLVDYLLATWDADTRPPADSLADEPGAPRTVWLGLAVEHAGPDADAPADVDRGTVVFTARFRTGGQSVDRLHEAARFVRRADGRWYYLDGRARLLPPSSAGGTGVGTNRAGARPGRR